MAVWKRRTKWAWPDWTYFFGCMVIVPIIDIELGSPLHWLNDPGSSRYGRASWVLEVCIVFAVLKWLDPIGRLMKIPGDAPPGASMSERTQAAVCLWIGVVLAVLGSAGVMWVHHLTVASGGHFDLEKHESLSFLLCLAVLFSFVCLLSGLIMGLRVRRERLEKVPVAVR